MGQKGTGRRLSDQERMEIIARLEGDRPRASAADCARQYGVSSAAITKLMKMKDKIKQRFKENNTFSLQRKRGGTERHAAFEDELFQWITAQQQELQAAAIAAATPSVEADEAPSTDEAVVPVQSVPKLPLTAAKVQQKAQDLLKAHNLGSFRASKGWYYRFCRRYGLSQSTLHADDGDHDDNDDGLDHSESESDGSLDADLHGDAAAQGADAAPGNGTTGETKAKRKASSSSARVGKKAKSSKGWSGVESLQSTLAKAAVALDHPEARVYLGENAAGEMLRSIQQSIGVVQCIRLKKTTNDTSVDAKEDPEEATISPAVVETTVEAGDVVV